MNKKTLLGIIFCLQALNVNAGLNDLINQNVINSDKSYEQIFSNVEQVRKPLQLWIHLRSENQKKLGEEVYQQVIKAKSPGIRIEKQPFQVVNYGPSDSQLRYFKVEDKSDALELLKVLRLLLPKLEIRDFSSEYSDIYWIKRGHIELWLSPNAGVN